ncbi:MAG: sigma-70 family RNA polymerase sigma factor, partial [Planctomycetes bacterium]|nr:sigma-70 family RNA polymerase sigma factor [Planctomycetota bacterium]
MTHHDAEFDIARAVQEHGQFLRRLAGALTSGDVSPEDLVQETWLVALQPPSRPIRNPRGFLATVMNRRAQRAARSASHRQRRERRVARTEADESPRHEDLLRELTDRLISLGEDSRRLLIGRYYEGLTARELARREGLPVATVETRLRRALATLRDRLDASSPSGRAGWSHAMAALAGGRAMPDSMSSWLGVGLVSKKLIAGVVAFLLLLAAWFGLGRLDADSKRPRLSGPESGAVEAGLDPVTRAKSEGKPVVSRSRSRAQPANASAPGTQEARRLGLLGTLVVHARIEESRPAPGLRVSATTLDSEWGLVEVSGRTDALGTFVFEGLPVGRYEVCALRGGQQTVRVSAGQTTSMTLNLSGGRRVEGRVVDQDGRPLPRAEIWLSMAVDPNHGDLVDATDDRGRFQLEAVDSHRLAVFADGFEPGVVEIPSQGSSFETTIRLNRGGSVLDVRVEDEAGQPIANAYVMARQRIAALGFEAPAMVEVEEGHHPGSDALSWTGRTDSEGHLRWKGLARGPVTLWARAPGFAVSTAVVDPRAAAEATLVLADEHRLEGRVLDAHGYPMPEVRIDAGPYRGPRRRRCLSDADGHFVLRGLAPGALTLDLEAADRGDARVRVQIGASRVV